MTDKDIIELINRFEGSDISRLKIRDKDFSIELEKDLSLSSSAASYKEKNVDNVQAAMSDLQKGEVSNKSEESFVQTNETGVPVKAPLAGVFYSASKPGAKPYVNEGERVKKGDVLGLVEAMKMMNEIASPADGTVKKINVKNEEFVQFNETIMFIE